jgi:23S rRNA (adenine2503-C2)-methyltransferase
LCKRETGEVRAMEILRRVSVPTGGILVVKGERGRLECLSLGDYGKDVNIKCDALGLSRELSPVRHTQLLPLSEKWVVTVSTQYGCSMGCSFCDVPRVGPGRNATVQDLIGQVEAAVSLHPEVRSGARLNLHYARMGEPTWNPEVLTATYEIARRLEWRFGFHPVVSTMMPRHNRELYEFLREWVHIKNDVLDGEAGLQLSINSTDEVERIEMFKGNALRLEDIERTMRGLRPKGRKFTLNFAVADWTVDAAELRQWFSPEDYLVKLTPMHKTRAATDHGIRTGGDYTEYHPYQHHESALRAAGYDVLVFIASKEEDESRITCGNAILADRLEA